MNVFEDVNTLVTHIVQEYDWDELSYLKLQSGLYLSYAYYTKYYNIIKLEEPNTPTQLFEANFIATENGPVIEEIQESLFKDKKLYEQDVKRFLKDNIKKLYLIDERVLKNVDSVMMKIIDMDEEELIERVRSDDSWNYAYFKSDDKVINVNHLTGEYNHKNGITLVTAKETFDYSPIL